MKSIIIVFISLLSTSLVFAQQTVGVFTYEPEAAEGYTLFNPIFTQSTLLIDNCGREVNRWDFAERHGVSAYLTPQGDLLRAAQYSDVPSPVLRGGGAGGRVQLADWDGNLLWQYDYSQDFSHRQHHDVELMPNGNVLILAWEYKTPAEALAAGRDTVEVSVNGLWPEMIVEVQPTGATTGTIVWEWHLWDHIIQDRDPALPNFGSPAANLSKLDINYVGTQDAEVADWIHANSIDYNAELDEILISSPHMNEIYIIDHSQSTAVTAGAAGDFKW